MANVEIPEGLEDLFQQTWFDHVLHYGLLVGAIFQLVCIAAIVIIPPKPEEESDGESGSPMYGSATGVSSSESTGEAAKSGTGSTTAVGGVSKKGGKKARKRK